MAIQTATNSETGERIALINGKWIPYTQSATNQSGQKAFLIGNEWVHDAVLSEPPAEQGFLDRAGAAAKRGVEQLGESASGIALGAKSAVGATEAAGKQAEQIRKEAEAQRGQPAAISWEELENTYGKEGALAALKKMPAYLAEQILQSAPSMAVPMAVGAGAAAMSGPLAPIVGPAAGIGTYGLQQFGQFMQRQAQEGATGETLAPGKAALAAAVTAPIGYFADRLMLGMGKIPEKVLGKQIADELAKRAGKSVAGRIAGGATVGVIAEAPTEVLEQAAERWQAGLPLTGEDAKREYKEAFFGAAAVGGAGGAGSRAISAAKEGLKDKAKRDAEAILAAEKPAETISEAVQPIPAEEAPQNIEELERAAGVAAPQKEPAPVEDLAPEETTPIPQGFVRVYHSGEKGEGEAGRWVSTDKEYASNYRPDLPLFYTDIPANDPRVNNLDYPDQGVKQGFAFNFELTPEEAAGLQEIPREAPKAKEKVSPEQAEADQVREQIQTQADIAKAESLDKQRKKYAGITGGWKPEELQAMGIQGGKLKEAKPAITAREFLVGKGGLDPSVMADANYDKNVRVGSKWLFSRKGGMSIENATEMLQQYGYLPEDATHDDAIRVIQQNGLSLEGQQRSAEEETAALRKEEERPEVEAGLAGEISEEMGYPAAPATVAEEANGLLQRAQEMGIDTSPITERLHEETRDQPDEVYQQRLRDELAPIVRGEKDVRQMAEKGQAGYNISEEDKRLEKELSSLNMLQASDWTVKNAPNAFLRVIAEKVRDRLRSLERSGVELTFKVETGDRRTGKMFGARGHTNFLLANKDAGANSQATVTLNGAAVMDNQRGYPPGVNYKTVLHELLHVATIAQFRSLSIDSDIGKQWKDLWGKVSDQYSKDLKAGKLPPVMQKYADRMNNVLQDPDELLAWGLSDEEVQNYLSTIKVGDKSAMTKLVELIRQVLGLGKPYESALDKLVHVSESMLDMDVQSIEQMMQERGKTFGKARTPEQVSMFQQEGETPKGRENIFGRRVLGSWTEPTDTKIAGEIGKDDIIYTLQDKMIDTKRVVQAITAKAGKILSQWNPYLQEELYHGRTAKETADFLRKELRPLMEEMHKDDIKIGEFEEYLHNRHAEAYNKQVAKVNPDDADMQDGGSGIKTEDARAYLEKLPADKRAKYEALADKLDAITKGTRELLVKSGLETRKTIEAWEEAFPDYVPLMREDVDFQYTTNSTGTGQGFDVRGPFSRRAMGSKRKVVDILANVAMQRERAIVKANKNRVAQATYGLAVQNPNPDFWLAVNPEAEKMPQAALEELRALGIDDSAIEFLMKEPRQRAVDPKKNEVMSRINSVLRNNDNVLSMRVNGENRYVFFNPNNERSARAAKALKNLDADQLGQVVGTISKITRWMASVNTQYNPIFGAYNFLRDIQGAMLQLSTTPLAGKKAEILSEVFPSLKAIYKSTRGERKGKDIDPDWEDFQKSGGQTGFRDMYSRSQERAEALQKELRKMSEGKLRGAGRATLEFLSDYNDTMENAVRLAAYKVALRNGYNKEEAASIAKNLTVNFNRKGQIGVQAGALYAFFNAGVQGTTRLYETMKGPAGKKIMAGGLLLGSMQAALLAMAGFDDEEPPEFVRERNIIIPTGGNKYIAFPMPLGYHVIPSTSRILTEWAMSGFKNTPERIASLTGMYLEAFNPIGNAGWSVQSIAPTFADPLVALAENKDWTGKPIARKDFSNLDPTPGYTRAKDSASWFSTQLAKYLNFASGGSKYQPGVVSPTPDQIDYLIGQATGGLGREALKISETVEKSITGEELPPYKVPLLGRFYGETRSSAAESNRFYKNLEHLNKLENEVKGRKEHHEPLGTFISDNPEYRLAKRAHHVYEDIKKLRERKEKLKDRGAPKESIQAVNNQITMKMRMLNQQVESAKK